MAIPNRRKSKELERSICGKKSKKTLQGRRTGVGITAEGDMLAATWITIRNRKCNRLFSVHKTIALNAYKSSVIMAKERGAFEIYDTERRKTIRLFFV